MIRKHEYDDENILAVDFGLNTGEISLYIVASTAIINIDGEQFEFEVPADADEIIINDGIPTIKQTVQQ
ncbi:DUF7127 family protein [Haladaptatus halobius]|uniref:DUF7127 family protein n=1 Tax=Haladaptatus halobius TaxID=2884875 RepID=UPI001D0B8ED0|nr:hypothetical protein [Haladaptatus halobius]